MNTYKLLSDFYRSFNEHDRLASRQGSVEFLTTIHYIERYLSSGMHIAEIGAGTGRYSHYFAQKGYPVDAVELLAHNIDTFQRQSLPGEPVKIYRGNAVDDETFAFYMQYHLHICERPDMIGATNHILDVFRKE